MLDETYFQFMVRWHLYRRWRRAHRKARRVEYHFHKVMRQAPPDGWFVDLGANVGEVTCHALRYGLRVIAFEPDPVAREVLNARFGDNDRVTIIPKAVGSSARTATFYQRPDVSDISKTVSSSLIQTEEHTDGNTLEVEVVDLVRFVREMPGRVFVIKMDIEGAEAECLEAILDSGVFEQVDHMFVETHERFSPHLDERIGKLRSRIASEKLTNIRLDWA